MEDRTAPARPKLAEQASRFMLLERVVEEEYRPRMLAELQRRVEAVAGTAQAVAPRCRRCGKITRRKDTRSVSRRACFGRIRAPVSRCRHARLQSKPLLELLDLLGVEPGRISGSLARLLAVGAPYPLAARLARIAKSKAIAPDTGDRHCGVRSREPGSRSGSAALPFAERRFSYSEARYVATTMRAPPSICERPIRSRSVTADNTTPKSESR